MQKKRDKGTGKNSPIFFWSNKKILIQYIVIKWWFKCNNNTSSGPIDKHTQKPHDAQQKCEQILQIADFCFWKKIIFG